MPSNDFRLLPEAEYQRLTPAKREEYMARLKEDLDEKLAERAREAQKYDRARLSTLNKRPEA